MAMNTKSEGDDDQVMSDINVTPLVDVMLVLLIIFLITSSVIKAGPHITLPQVSNIETHSKPENVVILVTEAGEIWIDTRKFSGPSELKEFIKTQAVIQPQPEVHIKADAEVRYANVGRVLMAVQQGGMIKVRFITEPESPTG